MSQIRDKYDDIKAEWMALTQMNQEFKRTLQIKVKENMKITKDLELQKQSFDLQMKEMTQDAEARLMSISSLQTEKDALRDQINQLESHIAVKEREVYRVNE